MLLVFGDIYWCSWWSDGGYSIWVLEEEEEDRGIMVIFALVWSQ